MQRQQYPPPPPRNQQGGYYASSPVSSISSTSTTAQRPPSEPSCGSTPHRGPSNGLKISNLLYTSAPHGQQMPMGAVYHQPQVQDLERQLAQAKLQLQQLRSGVTKTDSVMDPDYDVNEDMPTIPEIGCKPLRLNTPNVNYDYSRVCSKMRQYGQGLIHFPQTPYFLRPQPILGADVPPLPPTNIAHVLMRHYFSCVHCLYPVLHWPTILHVYERVHQAGTLQGVPRGWAAVFFALLGCGSLHSLDPDLIAKGKEYIKTSMGLIDLWQDTFSIEQARGAMLDLGFHMESGPWEPMDGEMRKRVWWSIYSWERLSALELGRPLAINDDDCDIGLPSSIEEQLIPEGDHTSSEQKSNPLLVIVHIMRCVSQLTKALKSSVISSDTLELFDRHFRMCLNTFPADYHMQSNQYLDPRSLSPVIILQNTRLVLHRHNLSPACPPETRSVAMNHCLAVARDTTGILTRCMRSPTSAEPGSPSKANGDDWRYLLAAAATSVICKHIWRCILLLLCRADYAAALVCIQASSAIGDARAANVASGRYIAFFLKFLLEKQQNGNSLSIEEDEELMAYVSGDLQSSMDNSWVWRATSPSSALDPNTKSPSTTSNSSNAPFKSEAVENARTDVNPEEKAPEWEGWAWVETVTQRLLSEQQKKQQQLNPAPVNGVETPRLDHPVLNGINTSCRPPEPTNNPCQKSNISKMTIANII
ncbi:fungal specific transcription factor domain-containing protein [Arthroderma uncinatum]|uniref:fungal specific transcription factor domain-containing protein n=1 Tax=Arthroderma uncinatum TaxID=74035 RepID=UPI00144A73A7|nr:fungal specific transcription factor domain-containing protein [Arthroderma uncinatum]KAF3481240.1 fungal specific transcription factor domain-containing protein [Arthroderma uncinatum]